MADREKKEPYPCPVWFAAARRLADEGFKAPGCEVTLSEMCEEARSGRMFPGDYPAEFEHPRVSTLQVAMNTVLVEIGLLGKTDRAGRYIRTSPPPDLLTVLTGDVPPGGYRAIRLPGEEVVRTKAKRNALVIVRRKVRGADDRNVWILIRAQGATCGISGVTFYPAHPGVVELDHIVPKVAGGVDHRLNLRATHIYANRIARDLGDDDEARRALELRGWKCDAAAAERATCQAQAAAVEGLTEGEIRKYLAPKEEK